MQAGPSLLPPEELVAELAEKLRRTELRLHQIQRVGRVSYFEHDLRTHVIESSEEANLLYGRTPGSPAFTVPEFLARIHPEDLPSVMEHIRLFSIEPKNFNFEHRFLRDDGVMISVRQRGEVLPGPDGRPERIVGTVQDISELRHTEEARQQSELAYRQLFERNPFPILVRDLSTRRHLEVNDAAIKHYGYSREELLTMNMMEIVDPDDRPRLEAFLADKPADYNNRLGRWVHRKKDGTRMDVEVASHPIVFKGRPARIIIVHDITDELAAETALRRTQERFQLVARATSDAIWDWDCRGDDLWWSDSFFQQFGYPPKPGNIESIHDWGERVHPEECLRVRTSLRKAVDTASIQHWTEEYRFLRGDGTYAYVQDRGFILRDQAGGAVRMVGGMSDITEHKKLLNQYLRAQRMESIGTLAGGIAHDLNNVLAPILLSIELLQMGTVDPASRQLIQTIETSTRRGADLVRQVLSFARGVEGQRVAIKAEHLLKDIARIATETFPRNLRIETKFGPDLWPISSDATQLHQVVLNLVVNARDAMPDGGTLTISAENITIDAQYAVTSREARPGAHLAITVTDTGKGMPPGVLERIFEPFYTTKDIGKGTGLGLSTAHAIVKSHGGFIAVYSEVGRGSSFKVYLPADPSLQPALPFSLKTELPRGRGQTILVVDDEAAILTITKQTLEAFGYRVLVAQDGAEAVAIYAQKRETVAAVLTDMVMPIMDGPATISALMRINPQVIIIAASGLNANGRVAKVTSLGVKHFLPKPYTAEALLMALHNVFAAG